MPVHWKLEKSVKRNKKNKKEQYYILKLDKSYCPFSPNWSMDSTEVPGPLCRNWQTDSNRYMEVEETRIAKIILKKKNIFGELISWL